VAAGAAAASILLGAASAGAWPLGGPGDYTMSWFTIDTGGGDSWIGNYSMMGTIGQHDSQNGAFIGDYTMSGGFWVPGVMTDQCPADVDDGSGTGTRDGGVGIEDLLYYLALYDAGDWRADVDDGTDTGTYDGGVGIEDLLYYLARYDAGC
jgi:hypothetical protein